MQSWSLRAALIVLLVSVHILLFVSFSATYPSSSAPQYYPGAEEVSHDPDRYVGDRVSVYGRVVSTSPPVIDSGGREFGLVGGDGVRRDSGVGVYGVYREDGGIQVIDSVEYTQGGLTYSYAVSFLAGLWVLARLLRDWTPGRKGLGRRGDA